MKALSPNGTEIIGTLEKLVARAEILEDSFYHASDGKIAFEYEGSTEVFWDDQETVMRKTGVIVDGQIQRVRVYLDDDGAEWLETQLALVEDTESNSDDNDIRQTQLPKFYRCGACDMYHQIENDNDCRYNTNRFHAEELDTKHGINGWQEIEPNE